MGQANSGRVSLCGFLSSTGVIASRAALLLLVVVAPQLALAQSAALTLTATSVAECPSLPGVAGQISLSNGTNTAQTIPNGTVIQLAFSVPVTRAPSVSGLGTFSASFSGNVLTITLGSASTLAAGSAVVFSSTGLSLQGLTNGTSVSVSVSTTPANAIVFSGSSTAVVATVDTQVCPWPVLSATAVSTCPLASAQVGTIALTNSGTTPHVISAGTILVLAFDPPVTVAPAVSGAGSVSVTLSGHVVSVALLADVTLAPGASIAFTGTALDLRGLSGNVGVTFQNVPANALFVPNNTAVVARIACPILAASTSSLSFSGTNGAGNPPAQTVTVSNSGDGGTLSWTGAVSTVSGGNWLAITPTSGGTPTSVAVAVNTTGLAIGSYQGAITITTPGASNSPQTINVSLNLTAAPFIQLTAASLTFSAQQGGAAPSTQTFAVNNAGGGALNFQASATTASGGNWLSVSPASGVAPANLVVAASPGALAIGNYTGTIQVSASGAANTPQSVSVTLTVSAGNVATITLNTTSLQFGSSLGGASPPPQTFQITDSGTSLSWTGTANTVSGGSWLAITPTSGSTPASVTVSVNSTGLVARTYQGAITITAPGAANSPQTVNVNLSVNTAPTIQLLPESLTFTAQQGSVTASNQSLQINNTGTGTLNFQASAVTTSGGAWLSVSPPSGTAPATLIVTANATVNGTPLTFGTYNGTIQASATGATNTPHGIAVTLTITPPMAMIALNPPSLRFVTNPGNDPPPAQTFQITNSGTSGATLGWNATATTTDGLNWLTPFPTTGIAPSTVQVSVNSRNFAPGVYSGSVRIDATSNSNASNSPQTVNVIMSVGAPLVPANGVVNGASFAQNTAVGPGGIISLFGTKLAASQASATGLPLPTTLNGVRVIVNGTVNAPLFYVSPTQINLQMPVEATGASASLVVNNGGIDGNTISVSLTTESPGIFTTDSSGQGQAAASNADFSSNSGSNAAEAGGVISLFATGLGATSPPFVTGQAGATQEPLNRTVQHPVVTVGGVPAIVPYSGLAPGFVGLYQVNVTIPPGTAPGSFVPVQLTINGRASNNVTVAVR